MERKWKIYLITNDYNDKKYVGQTVRTIQERWQQHVNSSANREDKLKFHIAIRLLGASHFTVRLLEEVNTRERADEREIYWVAHYEAYTKGYNSTPGGSTLPDISNEKAVLKVSLDRQQILDRFGSVSKASVATSLAVSSISYACRNFCTTGGFYWCYCGDYTALKEHDAVTCDGKRYIVKVDINTFKVLDEYLGIDAAAKATGMSSTCISQLCNDQLHLTDIDFVMRWKVVWLREKEIVKYNKLLYKPFYVMMLNPVTLEMIRVFKDSYVACKAFEVGRNTLEKHVDVPNSIWRGYLWCTCKNYNEYVRAIRR